MVSEIRAAVGVSHRCLAAQYGVSRSLIGKIIRREKWAHIP
jgi:predicted transcriptional regulator